MDAYMHTYIHDIQTDNQKDSRQDWVDHLLRARTVQYFEETSLKPALANSCGCMCVFVVDGFRASVWMNSVYYNGYVVYVRT